MRFLSSAFRILLIGFVILAPQVSFTQVYSNKEVGKKNQQRIDSLKSAEYPYILPILGKQATKKGFSLPYSAGIGVNYLWQKSDLVINNLQVGFNHNPMQNMDQVIRFNNATSEAKGLNIRPDVWLLPFLNVYAIFAKSSPSTNVDFGIYAPDGSGGWNNIINLNTKANFNATTFGLGVTPTIGVGGGWMALDMNFTWNDIPELEKPAFAFIFGPRFGKTFRIFKAPERNIALWAGGFRLHLNSGTSGSINLNDLIDTNGLQQKVNDGIAKVDASQQQVDGWWNGLTPIEQKNPVNVAKYDVANKALATAGNFLNGLDAALNDEQHASVQYALDKRPKDMWNFIIGTQYQHNKHWIFRFEYGFLGSRTQTITMLQYRFGL
ncbi:MAG TPA: hypothetical protein VGQ59_14580 [Cyclobacteriaceae bacterium]|jgi:hypothetical protein|nr:hypothetical protein [Cyclobacteriaceae bacterium]